jgi:hypothetical protein
MRAFLRRIRWLLILGGTVASCATAPAHWKTQDERLADRLADAPKGRWCNKPCPTDHGADPSDCCYDERGWTWSGCAWNLCGFNPTCRGQSDRELEELDIKANNWR